MDPKKLLFIVVICLVVTFVVSSYITSKSFHPVPSNSSPRTIELTPSAKNAQITPIEYKSPQSLREWKTYVHPGFNYSLKYPPEFTVKNSPISGEVEDAVTFSFQLNSQAITTVAQVQIIDQNYNDIKEKTQKVTDKNGNTILFYYLPYEQSKTLLFIGIAYPGEVSGFMFNNVLDEMKSSISIQKS